MKSTPPPTLFVFRGLPGSGKTTSANKIGCLVVSPADMYSTVGGEYRYADRIGTDYRDRMTKEARSKSKEWAKSITKQTLEMGCDVAIAEVLPTIKSVLFWKRIVDDCGANFVVTDCKVDVQTSIERNVHNVPTEAIRGMDSVWEDWPVS